MDSWCATISTMLLQGSCWCGSLSPQDLQYPPCHLGIGHHLSKTFTNLNLWSIKPSNLQKSAIQTTCPKLIYHCQAVLIFPEKEVNSNDVAAVHRHLQIRHRQWLFQNKTTWHRVMASLTEFHEDMSKRLRRVKECLGKSSRMSFNAMKARWETQLLKVKNSTAVSMTVFCCPTFFCHTKIFRSQGHCVPIAYTVFFASCVICRPISQGSWRTDPICEWHPHTLAHRWLKTSKWPKLMTQYISIYFNIKANSYSML